MAAVVLPATGRPVDVVIETRAHAILSASSAERWLTCTPSARIEEALPDRPSQYAADGTAAHAFAELRLRYLLKQITKAEYLAAFEATAILHAEALETWDQADKDAINTYVDFILERAAELKAEVHIEQKVDYSRYAEGGFGTCDALLVSETFGLIEAHDLKFGKGVPVSAANNSQAKLYTLGGFLGLPPEVQQKIKTFRWGIHQPRLDYTGFDECTKEEMREWAENVVKPAAEAAWKGEGELTPSDKACRFCKAAGTCRARAAENVLIARRDFMELDEEHPVDPRLEERLMDNEEIGRILEHIQGWKEWASSVEKYALETVRDRGETIPGFKLVRGRSNRAWRPGMDIPAELRSIGIDDDDIFPPPADPKPRSVAQLETHLGKKTFAPIAEALVVKPLGTPALVRDADPRQSIDAEAEAAAEFGVEDA